MDKIFHKISIEPVISDQPIALCREIWITIINRHFSLTKPLRHLVHKVKQQQHTKFENLLRSYCVSSVCVCVRDYGNQISIFAFGAKSWGISFSNQIHKRELHEFYILEQWPRAMECYQKFSQPKIFTQNQSSIMRQTTQNIVSRNEKWKIQKKIGK